MSTYHKVITHPDYPHRELHLTKIDNHFMWELLYVHRPDHNDVGEEALTSLVWCAHKLPQSWRDLPLEEEAECVVGLLMVAASQALELHQEISFMEASKEREVYG